MIWIDYVFCALLIVIFIAGTVPTLIELIKEWREE